MKISRTSLIQAPADEVWRVLGPNFADAYTWASSIDLSKGRSGPGPAGAPCAGRVCDTELGKFQETLEVYDEIERQLSYTAQGEKMPFFVRRMHNAWTVTPEGADASRVNMTLTVDLAFPFNLLMGLPMRLQLGGVLRKVHEELKYYVEHDGAPHPRKIEAIRRAGLPAGA
ncbi:MAG: SRPBCC family protein [Myxococcota bacterium]